MNTHTVGGLVFKSTMVLMKGEVGDFEHHNLAEKHLVPWNRIYC